MMVNIFCVICADYHLLHSLYQYPPTTNPINTPGVPVVKDHQQGFVVSKVSLQCSIYCVYVRVDKLCNVIFCAV